MTLEEVDERRASRGGARDSSASNGEGASYGSRKPAYSTAPLCRITGGISYYENAGLSAAVATSEVTA